MESRRYFEGKRISIATLIDDGHTLASQLTEIAKLPPSERGGLLQKVVRPIVQIVEPGVRCNVTGLDLMDVWRYFRHTWSLEYRPTPGRSLMFIIRNEARSNSPVMAIGALANATLQLRARDDWIGWTPKSLVVRLRKDPTLWKDLRRSLLRTLDDSLAQTRADDLYAAAGDVSGERLEARLRSLSADAVRKRSERIQERAARAARGDNVEPLKRLPLLPDGAVDWLTASEAPLFVAKRAKTLAEILFAKRIITDFCDLPNIELLTVKDDDLARAFSIAMREVRKVGLASRLLELNVCGAVAPYRDLLVGKLAALAVASNELRDAYAQRYARQPSEIASQMAGREVIRDADVCVTATTSLYGLSASQYNRIRVEISSGDVLHWHDLDVTEGYGTTHLGEETVTALRKFSERKRNGRYVNNIFGEGTSARLRQIRDGLDELHLEADALIQHNTPRRVYAIELFSGARDALTLNRPSNYVDRPFEAIAEAWRRRWLTNRVTFTEAIRRMADQGPHTVHEELALPNQRQLELFAKAAPTQANANYHESTMRVKNGFNPPNLPLIENLYRATGACADHHDAGTIRLLHIETSVDEFLRRRASQGGVVFVTGNPGDGKTHLLKKLEAELQAAKMDTVLDANEATDDELISRIDAALKRKARGLALAVNEGVLVTLLRTAHDRPWARSAREQVLNPFVYKGEESPTDPSICVLDLNLRNNLGETVVRKALERIVDLAGPCETCPGSSCSLQFNASRLTGLAADRLVALLDAVARTGLHATMRDLQGFLSFALFGPLRCLDFKAGNAARYWHNAFEGGQGPLFDAVRVFDPYLKTLPLLDDALWRGVDTGGLGGSSYREH